MNVDDINAMEAHDLKALLGDLYNLSDEQMAGMNLDETDAAAIKA
jgi:hypothetical protein